MWQKSDIVESMEMTQIRVYTPWKAQRDAFPSVQVIKNSEYRIFLSQAEVYPHLI
jgi:hypothetical protein